MAAMSCTLLVDTANFLNQALLRLLGVTDAVLVANNVREALDLLHTACPPSGVA